MLTIIFYLSIYLSSLWFIVYSLYSPLACSFLGAVDFLLSQWNPPRPKSELNKNVLSELMNTYLVKKNSVYDINPLYATFFYS